MDRVDFYDLVAAAGAVVSAAAGLHEILDENAAPYEDAQRAAVRLLAKWDRDSVGAVVAVAEHALDLVRWALFALDAEVHGPFDPDDESRGHRNVAEWMHQLVVVETELWEGHRHGRSYSGTVWCLRHHNWHPTGDGCPDGDEGQ